MVGGQDLDTGSDLRAVPDPDLNHIKHDAAEVQEHVVPQKDVIAIIAVEGRPYGCVRSDLSKPFMQRPVMTVVPGKPFGTLRHVPLQFGVAGDIQVTRQHFLLLAPSGCHVRSCSALPKKRTFSPCRSGVQHTGPTR